MRLLPALERYHGPSVRVVRRWLSDHPEGALHLDVYVLSAEFGLIPAIQPIPTYDRSMTTSRARALRDQVRTTLTQVCARCSYADSYLSAGKRYREALGDPRTLVGLPSLTTAPEGAEIGRQLTALKRWLMTEAR
ncbi:hypothetical protein EYB53_010950 [Candidatus Chloroploca sp. M-50]|uniref:DUF6884 domain-containing protein n=1 Tax=Candidatus Chloroploca mongolica TaxID=2528176 RepID=A0ABS4D9V3_9CHLR|nr:DUF6884 domain-containing protein [Candidatus Chloroploca mongolica]MBP1466223.1 hypothetical protein [Candidatus Chloroploca mongolica]